jgi:DNA polymerase III alpha subunit
MQKDLFGNLTLNEQELFDVLYTNPNILLSNITVDNETYKRFLESAKNNLEKFELPKIQDNSKSIEDFDKINQQNWFMPKNYCPNLIESIYELCDTDEKKDRVTKELELFIRQNMLDVLFYLKYLVDIMRNNNIIWGVGRGSCVSSYVLYLIGIHKIDSIKYNLEITEFLK